MIVTKRNKGYCILSLSRYYESRLNFAGLIKDDLTRLKMLGYIDWDFIDRVRQSEFRYKDAKDIDSFVMQKLGTTKWQLNRSEINKCRYEFNYRPNQ